MTRVFADTSFYVAAVNSRDSLHSLATDKSRNLHGDIITTEHVLIDALTADHHFEQAGFTVLLK